MAATDDPGGAPAAGDAGGPEATARVGPAVGAAITVLAIGVAIAFGASRADDPARVVRSVAALHDRAAETGTPALPERPEGFVRRALRAGWVPTGARADAVEGRDVRTVFWQRAGRRISWSRIAGPPVRVPDDARRAGRGGLLLRSLEVDGRVVVAWAEAGSTTVISAIGISRDSLYGLAGGPPRR